MHVGTNGDFGAPPTYLTRKVERDELIIHHTINYAAVDLHVPCDFCNRQLGSDNGLWDFVRTALVALVLSTHPTV